MPEDKDDMRKWILVVVAIIALAITAYQLYISLRPKEPENGEPPLPPPPECETDADCPGIQICVGGYCVDPEIPGDPEFWSFNEHFDPVIHYTFWLPVPVHLSSITGSYFLKQTCPQCWFKQRAGVTVRAVLQSGPEIPIFTDEPPGGHGEGWHNIAAAPGLDDVIGITIIITRWYGIGDRTLRLTDIMGELVVFV